MPRRKRAERQMGLVSINTRDALTIPALPLRA